MRDWELAARGEPVFPIRPLESIWTQTPSSSSRRQLRTDLPAPRSPSCGAVFGNLANKPLTDTTWGNSSKHQIAYVKSRLLAP